MAQLSSPQVDLFSKKDIKIFLKKYKAFPKKRFGQNFLIDKKILRKIMEAAGIGQKDVILEIGSGIGNLTHELARNAKKVIAIEKDMKMVEILKENTKNLKNVKIINSDVLKIPNYQLPTTSYKIVANLPYYIVSPVIRKFLESGYPPKLMVLMVQKEVAQRIIARPPNMSLLAVSVQFYAKTEIVSYVSKKSFWPQPKVDSAILRITPRTTSGKKSIKTDLFFKIVRAGFSQPRKQIINNLSKCLKINREKTRILLLRNKIQPNQRAETLTLKDWSRLANTFDVA
ncbi:ribosomal RNA small subunit methyltransferase A [Patescibacteria group bacterium]|nr:ribosomal RNA small subunit methyltransferase A [Patescibacteria group bacterium]